MENTKNNSWQSSGYGKKNVETDFKQKRRVKGQMKEQTNGNTICFSHQHPFLNTYGRKRPLVLLPYGILFPVSYACSKLKTTVC